MMSRSYNPHLESDLRPRWQGWMCISVLSKMRLLLTAALLGLAGLTSSCLPSDLKSRSDLSHFAYTAVPHEVVAALPEHIANLPEVRSMPGIEFLNALNLGPYRGNITGSVRHSATMLILDSEHSLEIQFDRDAYTAITSERIDAVLEGRAPSTFKTKQLEVTGCTLWGPGKKSGVRRDLANRKTEQVGAPNP